MIDCPRVTRLEDPEPRRPPARKPDVGSTDRISARDEGLGSRPGLLADRDALHLHQVDVDVKVAARSRTL